MIVEEHITQYIRSLIPNNQPFMDQIEEEAMNHHVPIVKPETKELLRSLVLLKQPKNILEIGTAVGFSALYLHQFQPEGGKLTTIERNPKRIAKAKENFKESSVGDSIILHEGDAAKILPTLTDTYDMIFVDAAKGQYIHFLPYVMERLAPGGLMVSDNVLQDGDIAKSRYAIERRDRTIHKRMRDYLQTIKHHPNLDTTVLTVGDGVAISIKQEK